MAMMLGSSDDDDDGALNAAINTTPLVDVMLVLLIIFLITIPVVTKSVPVKLPHETNIPNVTKPVNIIVAIDKEGSFYWNDKKVPDRAALLANLKGRATEVPQPEVHIRADKDTNYKYIGEAIIDIQRAGIAKVAFITEPVHGILAAQ